MIFASPSVNHQALAVYLHIPFCQTRCSYCAFNTYTGQSSRIVPYMRALTREIQRVTQDRRDSALSLYFGGGTPSLVPVSELQLTLQTCAKAFSLSSDVEITLETNPGTVDRPYLDDLRHAGVNRLSIGLQSAHASELQLFARGHTVDDVRTTVHLARLSGFENVNLDLIYGVPHQTLRMWQISLQTALDLNPDHLSLYGLGIEPDTPLERWINQGDLPIPDSDLAADMYEWASEVLLNLGYVQYEISNWARPGCESRHNLHYWRNFSYLGFGAGAHGYAARTRYSNVLHPAHYIQRIESQLDPLPFPLSAAADEVLTIDSSQEMSEMMLMSLRLLQEGLSLSVFHTRFGQELWNVYGSQLDRLIEFGLLERTPDARVRLTQRGRLLGNQVFAQFV
ncbi:MAG TPA: radical SAM family heme chaperone HemW [Aggregatilineaceae bacterium]|nr:radical SAM family heme chaperone HemW [Aggregatilineaceae bacterium]